MPCRFDPRTLFGTTTGKLSCPACGGIVMAGIPHPPAAPIDQEINADRAQPLSTPCPIASSMS